MEQENSNLQENPDLIKITIKPDRIIKLDKSDEEQNNASILKPEDNEDTKAWKRNFKDANSDAEDGIEIPVYPFNTEENPVATFGRIVSLEAAIEMMVKGKWKELIEAGIEKGIENLFKNVLAVTFSKQTILQLLSQPGCEGIKIFTCLNNEGQDSNVLIGVDKKGNELIGYKGNFDLSDERVNLKVVIKDYIKNNSPDGSLDQLKEALDATKQSRPTLRNIIPAESKQTAKKSEVDGKEVDDKYEALVVELGGPYTFGNLNSPPNPS